MNAVGCERITRRGAGRAHPIKHLASERIITDRRSSSYIDHVPPPGSRHRSAALRHFRLSARAGVRRGPATAHTPG